MSSADEIIKAFDQAKGERQFIETNYRDCFDFVDPIRGTGLSEGGNIHRDASQIMSEAGRAQTQLYDSTATDAAMLLASATFGGLTPANARWFDVDIASDPENRNAWLDESADVVWREIHASNYDSAGFETIFDSVIAGIAPMYIDFDPETQKLTFEEWPLANTYLASTRADGVVDTIYRRVQLTAAQAVRQYGEEQMHADLLTAHRNNDSKRKFDFVQVIEPRKERNKESKQAEDKAFASCHVDVTHRKIVRESGYDEFPVAIARWFMIPGSVWATGPVWRALPNIKTLQEAMRILLQNAEMQMSGMWGAVDDGVLNPSTIKIGRRAVIPMAEPGNFFGITPPGNIGIGDAMITMLQGQVRKVMQVENLQIPQDGQRTATEINVRMEITRQILAPIFGRLQSDWLQPLVTRCYGLLGRAGKLPPLPEDMTTAKLDVRFISPIARSQRLGEVVAMDRFENSLFTAAQVDPRVLDVYDFDSAEKERSWLLGVPQKLIRPDTKIKKIRDDREAAQQRQQEAAMQMAQQGMQQQ